VIHRQGGSYRNSLLPDSRKPFGDFSLSEKHQHFFLNHAGFEKLGVNVNQFGIRQISFIKLHFGFANLKAAQMYLKKVLLRLNGNNYVTGIVGFIRFLSSLNLDRI
jgi:hypothetical protein